MLTLMKKTERNNNRYEKIDLISFQNFLEFFLKEDLTWSNNEFIYNIRENPEKTNIEQILTKKFGQNNYQGVLERANIFFDMVMGKAFQSINWIFFHKKLYSNNRINFDDKDDAHFDH